MSQGFLNHKYYYVQKNSRLQYITFALIFAGTDWKPIIKTTSIFEWVTQIYWRGDAKCDVFAPHQIPLRFAGMLYDQLGSYDIPFYLGGVCFMICFLIHCIILLPQFEKFSPNSDMTDLENGGEMDEMNGMSETSDSEEEIDDDDNEIECGDGDGANEDYKTRRTMSV